MTVIYRDEATNIEAGTFHNGKLYFSHEQRGYIISDNPMNRRLMERDFIKHTGKSLKEGKECASNNLNTKEPIHQ